MHGHEQSSPGRWPPTDALGLAMLTLSTRPKSSALFMLSIASAASPRSSNWTKAKPRCFSAVQQARALAANGAMALVACGAREALSSGRLTSVISPKGRKAACRISCVTLSSSPPVAWIVGVWQRTVRCSVPRSRAPTYSVRLSLTMGALMAGAVQGRLVAQRPDTPDAVPQPPRAQPGFVLGGPQNCFWGVKKNRSYCDEKGRRVSRQPPMLSILHDTRVLPR